MSKNKNKLIREQYEQFNKYLKKQRERTKEEALEIENKLKSSSKLKFYVTSDDIERFFSSNFDFRPIFNTELWNKIISVCLNFYNHKKYKLRIDKFKQILKKVADTNNDLLDIEFINGYWFLTMFDWVKELDNWKPKVKGIENIFYSLIEHLLVKYKIPRFFYSVFYYEVNRKNNHDLNLFYKLATGESLFDLSKSNYFNAKLNRKMCHLLMKKNENLSIYQATRYAQLKIFGADKKIINAVLNHDISTDFYKEEDFIFTLLEWLAKQKDVLHKDISDLIDYFLFKYRENKDFSMKGRTLKPSLELVKKWKVEENYKSDTINYIPSGFKDFSLNTNKIVFQSYQEDFWKIEEILSSEKLLEEGRKMHHCVFTYSDEIESRETSIWSVKQNKKRLLTIEVNNESKRILQIKGKFNRLPDKDETEIVKNWAIENNLILKV
ncbi:MAG: PcfJ domain-containing protein [Candidatus Sericytochromatia bacterium]